MLLVSNPRSIAKDSTGLGWGLPLFPLPLGLPGWLTTAAIYQERREMPSFQVELCRSGQFETQAHNGNAGLSLSSV